MPNEIVVSLKTISAGPASEWITVHAEDPAYLDTVLDALTGELGTKIANVAQALRAQSAVVGGTAAPVQQVAPEAPAAPAQPAWGAPAAQAPVAQAPAQQWSAQPQAQAPAAAYAPPAPGAAPQGSDGYAMVWKTGVSKTGKPWSAWMSGAPRDFQGQKAEPIFSR